MRIQHNIPALNSYRNYGNNVSKVSKNLEKLSTGYRINRAGDDAAGLAISEKMRIQITGLEKAQSNAKSGINLVQTAEGALTEVHDMLNRMYDLAEQSANGTFDDTTDRKQLQKEIDSLRTEIDRIADSTNYNGIKLLDGSMENKTVASGAKDVDDTQLTIIRDGQLAGKDPQPGIFSVDLSNVRIKYKAKNDNGDGQIVNGSGSGGGGDDGDGDDDDTEETKLNALSEGGNINGGSGDTDPKAHDVKFKIMGNIVTVSLGEGETSGDELAVKIAQAIKDGKFERIKKTGGDGDGDGGDGDEGDGDGDGAEEEKLNVLSAGGTTSGGTSSASNRFTDDDNNEYNVTAEGGVLRFTMMDFPKMGLKDSGLSLEFDPDEEFGDSFISNQGNQWNLRVEQEPVSDGDGRIYAQAQLKLDTNIVKDGKTLTIGNETYVFAVGKNSVYKNYANVVDLTDKTFDADELVRVAAGRLTQVAANNSCFYVGTNYGASAAGSDDKVPDDNENGDAGDEGDEEEGEALALAEGGENNPNNKGGNTKDVVLTFTEKEGAIDYSKNNLGGKNSTSEGIYNDNDGVPRKSGAKKPSTEEPGGDGEVGGDEEEENLMVLDEEDEDDEPGDGEDRPVDEKDGTSDNNAKASDWAGLIKIGNVDATKSTHGLTLQIGDTAESFNQLKVSVADMHTVALGLDKIDISKQGNAQAAMDAIKKATNMVSDVRGGLGAIQNRLDHTINNLSVAQENIQDAESNIRDVDVAKEMMNYTKNNILVQSAQAMLAQANQLPQGVLQLLG